MTARGLTPCYIKLMSVKFVIRVQVILEEGKKLQTSFWSVIGWLGIRANSEPQNLMKRKKMNKICNLIYKQLCIVWWWFVFALIIIQSAFVVKEKVIGMETKPKEQNCLILICVPIICPMFSKINFFLGKMCYFFLQNNMGCHVTNVTLNDAKLSVC